MTSDAKVGLLLGLVFIFIIAFVINGLPDFYMNRDNSPATSGIISSQNTPPGYGTKERREVIDRREPQVQFPKIRMEPAVAQNTPAAQPQIPQTANQPDPAAKPTAAVLTTSSGEGEKIIDPKIVAAAQAAALPNQDSKVNLSAPLAATAKAEKTEKAAGNIYIVGKGETLTAIAKKLYGDSNGTQKACVAKIVKANAKNLKSANAIYEGQKLIIPQPVKASSPEEKNKTNSLLLSPLLEKVESIGRKHSEDSTSQATQKKPQAAAKPSVHYYTVKQNDTLWRIAASELGNSERYREITKLNSMTNGDNLTVGTVLKLPAK